MVQKNTYLYMTSFLKLCLFSEKMKSTYNSNQLFLVSFKITETTESYCEHKV